MWWVYVCFVCRYVKCACKYVCMLCMYVRMYYFAMEVSVCVWVWYVCYVRMYGWMVLKCAPVCMFSMYASMVCSVSLYVCVHVQYVCYVCVVCTYVRNVCNVGDECNVKLLCTLCKLGVFYRTVLYCAYACYKGTICIYVGYLEHACLYFMYVG